MNISRNNYEEFFLLYADGELNTADKQAVDNFVKMHPDLQEELEMLKETVLPNENISMPNKAMLLKSELRQEETVTPEQEALMLLLDNELPAAEASKLMQAIESNRSLQQEWQLLQGTKLDSIAIEHPDKATLYREENKRRVVPILAMRWMAAAAVLAGLGWFTISALTRQGGDRVNTGGEVAGVGIRSLQDKDGGTTPSTSPVVTGSTNPDTTSEYGTDASSAATTQVATASIKDVKQKAVPTKGFGEKNATLNPAPVQMPANQTIEYAVNPTTQKAPETKPDPIVALATPNNNEQSTKQIVSSDPLPTLATTASYKEDAVQEDAEYINIAGAHIKKQKIRGVLRNVTRTIGRTFDKSNVAQADTDAPINK